jgi:hypothetical protein
MAAPALTPADAAGTARKTLIVLLVMLLPLVVNMLQLGVGISPGAVALLVAIVILSSRALWSSRSPLDILVLAYVLWSLATGALYLLPSNRVDYAAYLLGINIAVVPVAFYALGRVVDVQARPLVAEAVVRLHAAVVVVSGVLQAWRPDFYTEYLVALLSDSGAVEEWQFYARMQGFLGSTALGILCSMSILLLIATRFSLARKLGFSAVFLVGAFLTFQRSSMVVGVAAFAVLLATSRASPASKLAAAFCAGVGAFALVSIESEDVLRLLDRLIEVGEVISLRDRDSYGLILDQLVRHPFGMGLGATTSAADSYGYNSGGQIVDANHLRILADLGPIGFVLFVLLVAHAVWLSRRARLFVPFGLVVLGYNLQALGTNVFDSYYTGHLYWMYVGMIGAATAQRGHRRADEVDWSDAGTGSLRVHEV